MVRRVERRGQCVGGEQVSSANRLGQICCEQLSLMRIRDERRREKSRGNERICGVYVAGVNKRIVHIDHSFTWCLHSNSRDVKQVLFFQKC